MSAQISSFEQHKSAQDSEKLDSIHRDIRNKANAVLHMLENCDLNAPVSSAPPREFLRETAKRNLERKLAREEAALAARKEARP